MRIASFFTWVASFILFVGCGTTKSDYMKLTNVQIKELEDKLNAGDSEAAMKISSHYIYGTNEPKLAIPWLRRAAAMGNKKACPRLKEYDSQPAPDLCQ